MPEYRLLLTAERDLESIHRYTVTRWNEAQVIRYVDSLTRTFERLAGMPLTGTVVTGETRVWTHEKHRIFYRVVEDGIEIGRILHHSRSTGR